MMLKINEIKKIEDIFPVIKKKLKIITFFNQKIYGKFMLNL